MTSTLAFGGGRAGCAGLVSWLLWMAAGGCSSAHGSANALLRATRWVRQPVPYQEALPRELDKTVVPTFVLQAGDEVAVEPASSDSSLELPGEQAIQPDGTVDLGKYGRVVASGKTVEELEAACRAAVKAGGAPRDAINVRLVRSQSAVYYVLGAVDSPGAYGLIGSETVLDALLNAGGLTEQASQCGILLVRPSPPGGCRTVLPVCYRQIVQLGDTTTNYQVMPGDRIFVAQKCSLERRCKLCEEAACACPTGDVAIASLPVYSNADIELEGAVPHDSPEVVTPPKPEPMAKKPSGPKRR